MSELYINNEGKLCEQIQVLEETIEYKINGITEHTIFGVYFSFINN